jgi:hypothetical protein
MPSKPKPKSATTKPPVKTEKAASAELAVSGKQGSGLLLAMALRPAPTAAQLDARQEAAKTRRKASGPPRKGTAQSKIKAPEVPPCNPRNK